MSYTKNKIRLLPIVIFVTVLSLSIKISRVVNIYQETESSHFSISTSSAFAEEKIAKETKQLTNLLQKGTPENVAAEHQTNTFSNSEIMILQELAERREALDIRAQEIDKRAIQLKVAESEIDKKIELLKEYEQRLAKLINNYSDQEKQNIDSLVKLYSSMKPKDAARIFDTMDLEITVAIFKGMKPSASSAILSQMDAVKAQAVTSGLIGNNI